MNKKHFSILLLICLLFLSVPFQTGFSPDPVYTKIDSLMTEYDTYVKSYISEREIPGVAVVIVINNQIEFIKGYGVRKLGGTDSIDIHSVFRLASVSKPFASILTGMLVKEGILNWDDTVIKYIPDFSLKDSSTTKNLTIRHILSHTSGLTPHAFDNLIEANLPFETIVKRLKEVNIHCEPGECYGYQNTVYSLISLIIKSATGKNYTDLLNERLFQPLGMLDASSNKNDMLESDNCASPHTRRRGLWQAADLRDTYYNVPPAAGINASIYDMAYWIKGLLGCSPEILSVEIVKEVSKPVISTPREKYRFNSNNRLKYAAYGLGWRVFDYSGRTMIYHSGGMRGYYTQLAFLPKYKIGIAVLQNALTHNDFLYKFVDMYFGLKQDI